MDSHEGWHPTEAPRRQENNVCKALEASINASQALLVNVGVVLPGEGLKHMVLVVSGNLLV